MYVINGSAGQAVKNDERIVRNDELINMIDDIQYFRMEDHHPNYDLDKPLFDYDAIRKMSIDENNPDCVDKYENILEFEQYDPKIHLGAFISNIPTAEYLAICDSSEDVAKFMIYLYGIISQNYEMPLVIAYINQILMQMFVDTIESEYSYFEKLYIHNDLIKLNAPDIIIFIYTVVKASIKRKLCIYEKCDDKELNLDIYIDYFVEILKRSDDYIYRQCLYNIFGYISNLNIGDDKRNLFSTFRQIHIFKNHLYDKSCNKTVREIISLQYELFKLLDIQHKCIYARRLCYEAIRDDYIHSVIREVYDEENYNILCASGFDYMSVFFNDKEDIYSICINLKNDIKNIIQNNFYIEDEEQPSDWFDYIDNYITNYRVQKEQEINFH